MSTTEFFFPTSGSTCSLPSMKTARYWHTLDQLGDGPVLACGGEGALKSCEKFNGTSWSEHSTLVHSRRDHTSFAGQHGLLLLGGYYSRTTTEIVGGGEHYNLQQDTELVLPSVA